MLRIYSYYKYFTLSVRGLTQRESNKKKVYDGIFDSILRYMLLIPGLTVLNWSSVNKRSSLEENKWYLRKAINVMRSQMATHVEIMALHLSLVHILMAKHAALVGHHPAKQLTIIFLQR